MRIRRVLALAALALLPGASLAAQGRPAGWKVAFDSAGVADSTLAFVAMAPGWHITSGPGAVLHDPAHVAGGVFGVSSEAYIFSSTPGAGIGLVVGGHDIDAAGARYTAFVVAPDGRFRVLRRDGGATRELLPWTSHAAITKHPGGRANVKQVLAIAADTAVVRMLVNGTVVAELPRATVQPDGTVGFRVDPGLNVHVATLSLGERNVAPVPASR